ncbi:hypothetical protein DESAMIL20_2059 [Desulfurella amilsii]|uniref:Uncharacterized protein n=1 Tax=Desulfurella amilsii TaxID=1562698 RepID=A0A1X4XUB2_9BACT|nr:hypothetical protein [Desulfurella amilsii]OSS41121.1 hypothetical protein DESAMIL20_2059 [Desulfurella amilsii]
MDKCEDIACMAFNLWAAICFEMLIVLVISIILFISGTIIFSANKNTLFVGIFLIFMIISIFVIYMKFKKASAKNENLNKILPSHKYLIQDAVLIYFSLTIRAIIILLPLLGILAFFSKGDIIGRIYAVVLEFMVGYPSIYWYLKSRSKRL